MIKRLLALYFLFYISIREYHWKLSFTHRPFPNRIINKFFNSLVNVYEICAATRIRKLVKAVQYSNQFMEEVELHALETISCNSEAVIDTASSNMSRFSNMTTVDKMKYLCDNFVENGKFDFLNDKIPKGYQPYVKDIITNLNLNL